MKRIIFLLSLLSASIIFAQGLVDSASIQNYCDVVDTKKELDSSWLDQTKFLNCPTIGESSMLVLTSSDKIVKIEVNLIRRNRLDHLQYYYQKGKLVKALYKLSPNTNGQQADKNEFHFHGEYFFIGQQLLQFEEEGKWLFSNSINKRGPIIIIDSNFYLEAALTFIKRI